MKRELLRLLIFITTVACTFCISNAGFVNSKSILQKVGSFSLKIGCLLSAQCVNASKVKKETDASSHTFATVSAHCVNESKVAGDLFVTKRVVTLSLQARMEKAP